MNVEKPTITFENPFRPGAGHAPPYLAGRVGEREEFERLLRQTTILENLVLTGLRGVGKTVLLDSLKPIALERGWHWVGADLSESVSVSEESLAVRILADLSVIGSRMTVATSDAVGFAGVADERRLDFATLRSAYEQTPGLVADKLKAVLEIVAAAVAREGGHGVIFAYDEAQTLADRRAENEFPLSVLLDVFQSIQRKGIKFMLVLAGLPTLFPKLVEARTFSERMFRVLTLDRLDEPDSREAIMRPVEHAGCPIRFDEESIVLVVRESGGYPYFIQFICREVYDAFIQSHRDTGEPQPVPIDGITQKLDTDFFAGRWDRATDRQRQLLWCIAKLDTAEDEFTVQEIVAKTEGLLEKGFSSSHANQMLVALGKAGLVYKNRWGKYSLAVPLFNRFILRQASAIEPGQLA
ncbi:MAG TPA: AAA family ATPase [Solirubrobacteraceae bacterium]|jgi:type II secretory pathway predicted ATPase ExeA|nr:AAA family ATPase [Solirubrobacteraceae bacterium]